LLYLGFKRKKQQTPVGSSPEESNRNSPPEGA